MKKEEKKVLKFDDVCPVCTYCKLLKCTNELSEFYGAKCTTDTTCPAFKHWRN